MTNDLWAVKVEHRFAAVRKFDRFLTADTTRNHDAPYDADHIRSLDPQYLVKALLQIEKEWAPSADRDVLTAIRLKAEVLSVEDTPAVKSLWLEAVEVLPK